MRRRQTSRRRERSRGPLGSVLRRIPRWIEVTAAAVVVLGGAVGGIAYLVDRTESLLGGDVSQIEVRQVVVVNGAGGGRLVAGSFVQPPGTLPQIDITVRNTGKQAVLLTRARVTVLGSARLQICDFGGGPVPVAGEYAIELPVLPTPAERVVTRPLHQEVPAGGIDRFRLFFRAPRFGEDNFIYALQVELGTDESGRDVDVGRFVLGVPGAVDRGGRILPEGPFVATPPGDDRLASTWCFRHNLAEVDRFLRTPGRRSASMADLAHFQLADWWSDFADRRSPRASVYPLLHAEVLYGPALAVFAAKRTGDRELVERTRRSAAALLLRAAEDDLANEYASFLPDAVLNARYALSFVPSAEGRQLLQRAETRWQAAEEAQASEGGGFE